MTTTLNRPPAPEHPQDAKKKLVGLASSAK